MFLHPLDDPSQLTQRFVYCSLVPPQEERVLASTLAGQFPRVGVVYQEVAASSPNEGSTWPSGTA